MREVRFIAIPEDCAWKDGSHDCFCCPYCVEIAGDTATCSYDDDRETEGYLDELEEDTTVW